MSDKGNTSILQKALEIQDSLLPAKSRNLYEEEYTKFSEWCSKHGTEL
jgi:hypothetical protein